MKKSRITENYFGDTDSYLFHEGTNYQTYKKMGAHPYKSGKTSGVMFTVWAPNAKNVSVLTDADGFSEETGKMVPHDNGIWELFVPDAKEGDTYRFCVLGADGIKRYKSDPYGMYAEKRPKNASVIYHLDGYCWKDDEFMKNRTNDRAVLYEKPMAVYEVFLGSWKKDYGKNEDGFLNYREYADQLADYLLYMGYTHVELMGICEFPFDGSWGYQVTGFFAPTSRYGAPDDFRYFVDKMHQCGISVILDWVPAHYPKDSYGLEHFDGTPLYESADPLRAEYPEWGTMAFDHGKTEVRSFLISSALYWVNEFHVDALRVDAVAAMLYSSFSREKWRPNAGGGPENDESMAFLKQLNDAVTRYSDAYVIAEDSSMMAGITEPVEEGGFGFHYKWNMGWMNDTLKYIGKDPMYRRWHHSFLTHSPDYAFLEHFILVLSHDEVVHLKKSMLLKNPGNMEDKFGGLKVLYTYQMTHPGKKLLFMGQDFAQDGEWDENRQISWECADESGHRDVMNCMKDLLDIYKKHPVLTSDSGNDKTFEWINASDSDRNIISYIRRNPWNYNSAVAVLCNFSPVAYNRYIFGVPEKGYYKRIFSTYDFLPGQGNSDAPENVPLTSDDFPCDGRPYSLSYDLRPYEAVILEFPILG